MDLSFLRFAVHPGPWATVYIDASRATEEAVAAIPLRWRGLRTELADHGAGPDTLNAIEATVLGRTCGGHCGLAVFARAGAVEYAASLPAPPARNVATLAPVPDVRPMLEALGEPVAWVRAVVDHTGGDVFVAPGWPPNRAIERHIEGHERYPVHKAAPGGWSQSRYQRAAETTWERNAAEVADALAAAADQVRAEIVVVAGDVRSRQFVIEDLPERWLPLVVETDAGSRAAGAKPEHLDQATQDALDEVRARRTDTAWEDYRASDGARGRTGLPDVVDAVRRGQVETLLLRDDGLTGDLWIGPAVTDIAVDRTELATLGVAPVQRARADAAVLRAVAGTHGGALLMEEAELTDGVGAILRGFAAPTAG